MKRSLFFLAAAWACLAQAQNTYRWVDDKGKVHFGDRPPAATAGKVVEERRQARGGGSSEQVSSEARQAAEKFPVTLYVSTDCGEPCKQGVALLRKRNIPFAERNVASVEDAEALAKLTGGDTVVPVLQVGSKMRKGYASGAWDDLLDIVGYPKAAKP